MSKRNSILNVVMLIVEFLALIVFIILLKNSKLQMWLGIFVVGVIISLFAGRFYCGWLCQMHTIFKPINKLYAKLKIPRLKTPKFLQNDIIRILFVVLFIASMVLTKVLNLKVNILLFITIFSVIVILIFEEEFWHRKICPFGTILSITSKKSKLAIKIDEDNCISCGKCQKICPTSSIITLENKKRRNIKAECLLCRECIDVCPVSVIKYC